MDSESAAKICILRARSMLKSLVAGERAQAGVFARGHPPDAGCLRTTAPRLGAAGTPALAHLLFLQRPHCLAHVDQTARERLFHAEDRTRRSRAEAPDRRRRAP